MALITILFFSLFWNGPVKTMLTWLLGSMPS